MSTKTGYSTLGGGGRGYINIGGWNTTLTDVSQTAQECIGVKRTEGANTYMYAQLGTSTACENMFLSISTGYPDANNLTAPFGLTANGAASTGLICKGMTVADSPVSGVCYAWVLVEGFATGYAMTDSGIAYGDYVCPSTSTANLLDGEPTALTAVGRNLGVSVATGTASAAGEGVLIYWKFKSPGNFGNG